MGASELKEADIRKLYGLKFGKDVLDRENADKNTKSLYFSQFKYISSYHRLSKSTRRPEKFYAHNCLTGKRGGVPKQDPRSSLINEVHRFIVYSLMPDSELSKSQRLLAIVGVCSNIAKSGSAFSPKE